MSIGLVTPGIAPIAITTMKLKGRERGGSQGERGGSKGRKGTSRDDCRIVGITAKEGIKLKG